MRSLSRAAKRHRPVLALTERDRSLLRTVADFGVVSTEQAYRLSFPSLSRARKRLRLLWQHRLLKRHVRPVRMGEGSAALLYTPTRKGKTALAIGDGLNGAVPNSRRSIAEHALRINDFRTALTIAIRRTEGLRMRTWGQGKELRFSATTVGPHGPRTVPIVPDAFFTVDGAGQDFCYFLEIDRGTTDHSRIRAKLEAYSSLWQSKAASLQLGIRSFRVLYVTTTEKRLKRMLRVVQSLNRALGRVDVFSFTCFERYSLAQPDLVLKPIWRGADQLTGSLRVVCPFPSPIPSTLPIAPGKPPVGEPDAGAR